MKNVIMQWHTFWVAPYLICYVIIILFYIEKKTTFYDNYSHSLTLEVQIVWKISAF